MSPPQEKLNEIKEYFDGRDVPFSTWLIARIEQLEAALKEPVTVENVCDGCGLSTTIIDEPVHLSKALKEMP